MGRGDWTGLRVFDIKHMGVDSCAGTFSPEFGSPFGKDVQKEQEGPSAWM